jgi:hypothetical protein
MLLKKELILILFLSLWNSWLIHFCTEYTTHYIFFLFLLYKPDGLIVVVFWGFLNKSRVFILTTDGTQHPKELRSNSFSLTQHFNLHVHASKQMSAQYFCPLFGQRDCSLTCFDSDYAYKITQGEIWTTDLLTTVPLCSSYKQEKITFINYFSG